MLPDDSNAGVDKYGCQVVTVTNKHLKYFPALIKWIKERGYGQHGILKLRLLDEDRNDSKNFQEVLTIMEKAFQEVNNVGKRKYSGMKQYSFYPDAQLFYKATTKEHIYEFVSAECTADERRKFVNTSLEAGFYNQSPNYCTEALKSGCIRSHCFEEIDKSSVYSDRAKAKQKEWVEIVGNRIMDDSVTKEDSLPKPILYGAGIKSGPSSRIAITEDFCMDKLHTNLDLLEEKPDGIVYPYIYAGTKHSAFPWHIEDGGLFSINYHFAGAPKLWFGIQPHFYGLVDNIVSSSPIDPGHAACRALMADHKVLVEDPEHLKAHHGIPYSTVVKEPGEFVITFPSALHSGFNLGAKLAIAINLGDVDWLELAMHAPICACNETQVQLNLTSILKVCRPDLLEKYLCEVPVIPLGHPRSITCNTTTKPVVQNKTLPPSIQVPADCRSKSSDDK